MINDTRGFEGEHLLAPLVQGWLGKIQRARDFKRPWQEMADECMMFFSAATGFLWDAKYRGKFWDGKGGEVSPKFKITICKAFELVSLFGPMLYWRNPTRTANAREMIQVPEDLLAAGMGLEPGMIAAAQEAQAGGQPVPPQLQAAVAQFQQEVGRRQQTTQLEGRQREVRADLMQRYLNWSPRELGLHRHAESAITEALIKGRGILVTQPYRPRGSNRVMVGSFCESVDKLLIDPDAESPEFNDAWWIGLECEHPYWYLEREYGYPPGFLKRAAGIESANAQGERAGHPLANQQRATGDANDLVSYVKIWSRCGVGARLTDMNPEMKGHLEKVCGDYAHIVVAKGVPFPLNLSSDALAMADNDAVARAFRWPTPHWKRDAWPITMLDFYRKPRSAWPMPLLGAAMGELKALNCFIAHLCNRIWMSSRDFIVVLESAAEMIEKRMKEGQDLTFMRLPDEYKDIQKVVQFLQHPPTNFDAWKIVEALLNLFERRTGLNELLYGLQGKAEPRTATSSQIRQQNLMIRPQHMAAKVEQWMTDVAQREALAVRWWVGSEDVQELMGETGSELWRGLITESPVERTLWEIDYRVEAGSARKPNREREVANLNEAMPMILPLLQVYAQMAGDFEPLNWLIEKWGNAVELDTAGMRMQSQQPQQGGEQEQAEAQQEEQRKQVEHTGEQGRRQEEHRQGMVFREQTHGQDLRIKAQQAALAAKAKRTNGAAK